MICPTINHKKREWRRRSEEVVKRHGKRILGKSGTT
jgi:hypothetical protein